MKPTSLATLLFLVGPAAAQVCVDDVSAGSVFTAAVTDAGTVFAWGRNTSSQLGTGKTADSYLPAWVIDGATGLQLTGAQAVSSGLRHTLVLMENGTVKAFGANTFGQLGDGSFVTSPTAVSVVGISNIIAVSAGGEHSLALDFNGNVWAWGRNSSGQLGDGTQTSSPLPVSVTGITTAIEVAGGDVHSMAVLSDGTVRGWGRNQEGELGLGFCTTFETLPLQSVYPPGVFITDVAAANRHSLTRDSTGAVWASGNNNYGVLGNGTAVNSDFPTPAQVVGIGGVGLLTGVLNVAGGGAGVEHSLALQAGGGGVLAWGRNCCGQLGVGFTSFSANEPTQVLGVDGVGTLGSVAKLSAGDIHSASVSTAGIVHTWGTNSDGALGTGDTVNSTVPKKVFGLSDCDVSCLQPYTETVRLGTPPNPSALLPGNTVGPVIGRTWDPVLIPFLPGALLDFLAISFGPPINIPSGFGTLLCTAPPPGFVLSGPAPASFGVPIPLDCVFIGVPACTQAGSATASTVALTNALDIVIGAF